AQKRRKFHHFVSKKALNIDGLGPQIVDLLLEEGLINSYDDIFTLKEGALLQLPGFKEKSVENLLDSIQESKDTTLPRFIIGLSIEQVGEETAHDLAGHFGSLESIMKASEEELAGIEGIGDVVGKSISSWFKNNSNKNIVDKLLKYVSIEKIKKTGSSLSDKTFVLTGTLESLSRDEASEKIRSLGGNLSSSVSSSTDYVVVGRSPGLKFDTAKELRVETISENEFIALISS
ncbi:MAG: helix-hairpin-helix domain-containing protein, partial [Candidatus Pacebacteria bacterium]|nr:helix-hairpin-helix domain-containing protein [Candidatus Paceibacterota bacterium]